MAKDKRYTLTMKLNATGDRDLIRWYADIPEGERNQTVKNALRAALDLPLPVPPESPEVATLRADFIGLRDGTLAALRAYGQNGNDPARFEQIEKVVTDLWRRVDSLASLPAAALTSPEPVEAVPQMTPDEQQQRANKLKKASW